MTPTSPAAGIDIARCTVRRSTPAAASAGPSRRTAPSGIAVAAPAHDRPDHRDAVTRPQLVRPLDAMAGLDDAETAGGSHGAVRPAGERPMRGTDAATAKRFRDTVLPCLDDAYTLARYLTRNPVDADDLV